MEQPSKTPLLMKMVMLVLTQSIAASTTSHPESEGMHHQTVRGLETNSLLHPLYLFLLSLHVALTRR